MSIANVSEQNLESAMGITTRRLHAAVRRLECRMMTFMA